MGAWVLSSFRSNSCILAIYFDYLAPLVNLDIWRNYINRLMEGPHGLEMCRHKRWPLFFAWNKCSIYVGHSIVLIQVILEDRHAAQPVDYLKTFATDIQRVHK